MQQHLATEVVDDEALPARFEFLAGRKLEEIEKAWIAWGSDPPKLKDEKR